MVINSETIVSVSLAFFFFVIARNGDLSGNAVMSIVLYGGCLLFALSGSRTKYKYIGANKLIWFITLIPLLYSSAGWFDTVMFAIGIFFVIFTEYSTDSLKKLYGAVAFVAIINALCVFIQAIDKTFFDGFAKVWYPDAMYQQYLQTMKSEPYLNGCNAIVGNTAGYLIVFIGLFFSTCMIKYRKEKSRFSTVLFILCFVALLLTGKRGILASGIIAVIVIYVVSGEGSKIIHRCLLVVVTVFILLRCATLIAGLFPNVYGIARVANTIEGVFAGSDVSSGRLRLYGYALQQFSTSPLFGIGWKQFNNLTTTLYGYSSVHYVNNDYLQVLCETGIVGMICIYLPMLLFFTKSLRMYSSIITSKISHNVKLAFTFSIFVQIFYLVYSFFEIPLYDRCFFFIYVLAVSIGYCAQNEFRSVKKNTNKLLTIRGQTIMVPSKQCGSLK